MFQLLQVGREAVRCESQQRFQTPVQIYKRSCSRHDDNEQDADDEDDDDDDDDDDGDDDDDNDGDDGDDDVVSKQHNFP